MRIMKIIMKIMVMIMLVLMIKQVSSLNSNNNDNDNDDIKAADIDVNGQLYNNKNNKAECPICNRIINLVIDLAKERKIKPSDSLLKYCKVEQLENDERKFCYNIENVMGTLGKVLDLGADEYRFCHKVMKMNPDFCAKKSSLNNNDRKINSNDNTGISKDGVISNERLKRGIIYI